MNEKKTGVKIETVDLKSVVNETSFDPSMPSATSILEHSIRFSNSELYADSQESISKWMKTYL